VNPIIPERFEISPKRKLSFLLGLRCYRFESQSMVDFDRVVFSKKIDALQSAGDTAKLKFVIGHKCSIISHH